MSSKDTQPQPRCTGLLQHYFELYQEHKGKMSHRCHNIYDCVVEDVSKKQRSTELAIASAGLTMQLASTLFHLILKFAIHKAISFSPAQEIPAAATQGKVPVSDSHTALPHIYLWVLGKHLLNINM